MADNFVDAVKMHMERLAQLQAPQEPPPPDLDELWETLSPSLQQALDDRERRIVAYVNETLVTKR
jgi:hypothetical protein